MLKTKTPKRTQHDNNHHTTSNRQLNHPRNQTTKPTMPKLHPDMHQEIQRQAFDCPYHFITTAYTYCLKNGP
jgi:hypothetical protein